MPDTGARVAAATMAEAASDEANLLRLKHFIVHFSFADNAKQQNYLKKTLQEKGNTQSVVQRGNPLI
jgi:hypothetical protein